MKTVSCAACGADVGPEDQGVCPLCGEAQRADAQGDAPPPPPPEPAYAGAVAEAGKPPGPTLFGVPTMGDGSDDTSMPTISLDDGDGAFSLDNAAPVDEPVKPTARVSSLQLSPPGASMHKAGGGAAAGLGDTANKRDLDPSLIAHEITAVRGKVSDASAGLDFEPPPDDEPSLELDVALMKPSKAAASVAPPPVPIARSTSGHGDAGAASAKRANYDDLDLPGPVQPMAMTAESFPDLDDLPAPVNDLDLPMPANHAPLGGDDLLDLPAPSDDLDLPMPTRGPPPPPSGKVRRYADDGNNDDDDSLAPVDGDLEPYGQEVEPRDQGLEPAYQDLEPAFLPDDLPPAALGEEEFEPDEDDHGRSKFLVYGVAAVLVFAGLGVVAVVTGVLDDPPPPAADNNGEAQQKEQPIAPPRERSVAVLAKFATDDPDAYRDAMTLCRQAGDPVGEAESALWMHFRYGPDPVLEGQAAALLDNYRDNEAPFVRRVLALEALAKGDANAAQNLLPSGGERTEIVRGWIMLRAGDAATAHRTAQSYLDQHPDDVGALALRLTADVERDPAAAIARIEEALTKYPEHPALQELHVRAGIESGRLAVARRALAEETVKETSAAHKARMKALEARLYATSGEYDRATELYTEASKLNPRVRSISVALIRSLLRAERFTEASAALEDIKKIDPDWKQGTLLAAENAVLTGESQTALALVDRAEQELPHEPYVPYLRGQVFAMRNELGEGSQAFERAVDLDPDFIDAYIGKARMLAAARRYDDALATLDDAARTLSGRNKQTLAADILTERADLQLSSGAPGDALLTLDLALAKFPEHNRAQTKRGVLRLEQGDYDGGKQDLLEVFRRTGGFTGLTGPLGRVLVRERRLDELEGLVGELAADAHASTDLKLVATRLRLAQGRPDDAKLLLDQVFTREPNHWEAQMLKAVVTLDLGDPETALAIANQVKPKRPQSELHLLRGKLYEYNDRHAEAQPEYRLALQLDPTMHEARFLLGRLLAFEGKIGSAIEELQLVVNATDHYPEAWLNLARAQREAGRSSDAAVNLKRALELDPELFEAHYLLGRISFEQNKLPEAVLALEQAVDGRAAELAWYPDAWNFLGRVLQKLERKSQAKEAYERFLALADASHPSRRAAEQALLRLR